MGDHLEETHLEQELRATRQSSPASNPDSGLLTYMRLPLILRQPGVCMLDPEDA